MKYTKEIKERFWAKVNKEVDTDCWEWSAAKSTFGYGRFKVKGKLESPHRISYELSYGKIPKGLFVCHTCDNPSCVNPDHLFSGTRSDNMKDCASKGRLPICNVNTRKQVRGEGSKQSSLTEKDVLDIRRRLAEGEKGSDLAREYKIWKTSISCIKHRKTWKHI